MVVDKHHDSQKAEHAADSNMAAFVEHEWGGAATELMWRVKQLADPTGILAPGVVLNRDPEAHLRNLKSTPEIEEVATKCIECGFCEPVCPSRHVTTTPRQRIVVGRDRGLERAARIGLRICAPLARKRMKSMPGAAPAQLPLTIREAAAAVYMPSCINRMFGSAPGEAIHPTLPEALVAVSRRAGL